MTATSFICSSRKLNEMRVFGMTPPDDLLEFEAALDEEFATKQPAAPRPAK